MADDLFDGAIGIDLGTTYSCVVLVSYHPPISENLTLDALVYGKTTVLRLSQTTVSFFTQFFVQADTSTCRGKPNYPFLRCLCVGRASDWWCRKEPGCHEPPQHRVWCQASYRSSIWVCHLFFFSLTETTCSTRLVATSSDPDVKKVGFSQHRVN